MKRLLKNIPINLVIFAIGFVLFYCGAYWIYPPAALISSGLILMGITLFGRNNP